MGSPDARLTASVYVDGLNLYRRLLAGRPELKWLDVEALAERILPEYQIVRVRYFTAIIKVLPGWTSGRPSGSSPTSVRSAPCLARPSNWARFGSTDA